MNEYITRLKFSLLRRNFSGDLGGKRSGRTDRNLLLGPQDCWRSLLLLLWKIDCRLGCSSIKLFLYSFFSFLSFFIDFNSTLRTSPLSLQTLCRARVKAYFRNSCERRLETFQVKRKITIGAIQKSSTSITQLAATVVASLPQLYQGLFIVWNFSSLRILC